MLPGKKYTPEDFLRIAWNRKWLIAIPTVVIAAGTFVWSYRLPNRYRAETTILVVPQRVPEDYVRSDGHRPGRGPAADRSASRS